VFGRQRKEGKGVAGRPVKINVVREGEGKCIRWRKTSNENSVPLYFDHGREEGGNLVIDGTR